MSKNYRIVTYAKISSVLPKEYKQLEYITSTGTQYIATGVSTSSQNIQVSTVMKANYITNYTKTLGYSTSTSGPPFSLWAYNNNYDGYGTVTIVTTGITEFNPVTMSGTNITIPEFYIFELNPSVTSYNKTVGSIQTVVITVDGEQVRNLIPAQRKSDDKVGLYDTINGVFYTNAATSGDDFIAGPDGGSLKTHYSLIGKYNTGAHNFPAGYKEHTYLTANDRTAQLAIPLNFSLDNTCKIETKMNITNDNGTFLYGARMAYCNSAFACFHGWAPFGALDGSGYVGISSNMDHIIEQSQDGIVVDGTTQHTYTTQTFDTTVKCAIFNCTQGVDGTYYRGSSGIVTCCYFKVWKNGTLIFEGYPAKRVSDSMPGIYDVVQQQFFCCANTTFADKYVLGPEVIASSTLSCIATEDN